MFCAIVIYAAYLVKVTGQLDKAGFFLVMACLMGMGESLRKLSKVNNHLQRANAAAARIFETLDMPVERPRELTKLSREAQPATHPQPTIADGNGQPARDARVVRDVPDPRADRADRRPVLRHARLPPPDKTPADPARDPL